MAEARGTGDDGGDARRRDLTFDRCRLSFDDAVAVLRLDHPEVMNAVSPRMVAGLREALAAVADPENGARCLVLTGEGRAFCTGANLQEMAQGEDGAGGRRAGSTLETVLHPLVRQLRDLGIPIVTAVNGPAAGAGMSLALMGDLVVCARSAYFLQEIGRAHV